MTRHYIVTNTGEWDSVSYAHAIDRGELVGFYWGTQSDLARPDAWCAECNEKRKNPGLRTEDKWFQEADFKMLCEHCWDEAKRVCGGFRV